MVCGRRQCRRKNDNGGEANWQSTHDPIIIVS